MTTSLGYASLQLHMWGRDCAGCECNVRPGSVQAHLAAFPFCSSPAAMTEWSVVFIVRTLQLRWQGGALQTMHPSRAEAAVSLKTRLCMRGMHHLQGSTLSTML